MATSLSDASFLSKSHLDVIYRALGDLKLKDKEVSIEPLGDVGDNFVADVRVIKVKDGDEKNDFRIIMKLRPVSKQSTMSNITSVLFNNEIAMYADILPTFSECQEKAGVELKDAFQFATCYGFSAAKQQEIILLEDLSKLGYTLLSKYNPLSNETIKLVLTKIADYHSMSYALKDKSPDLFNQFAKRLTDMNDVLTQDEMQGYSILGENISNIVDKDEHKKLIKNLYSLQSMEKAKKIKAIDTGSKYSVIIHGDLWTNNILFRIDGEKTTDCILIDYQLCRESMPVIDILYLIFNCTDYETRSKHYEEWLNHYHARLEKSLFNFGLRVNNVYPKDKLDSDMMRYAKQVLSMAVMTLSLLLRDSSESAKFKESMNSDIKTTEVMMSSMSISTLHMESVAKIRERIQGLMDSCFELGLVNTI